MKEKPVDLKDIRIDTWTSGCFRPPTWRITHLPTGIVLNGQGSREEMLEKIAKLLDEITA